MVKRSTAAAAFAMNRSAPALLVGRCLRESHEGAARQLTFVHD